MEIRVENLVVRYPLAKTSAVDSVSFRVPSGSMAFILGPNGCGKSSLLRCVSGLQWWKSGEIFINKQNRKLDYRGFNSGVHYLAEDVVLPDFTIEQLAKLYKILHPEWDQNRWKSIFHLTGLESSKATSQVSRGQRIQIHLALALASRPKLLIADEITAVLDPFMRNRLISEIVDCNKQYGTTVLLSTNIATELRNIGGAIFFMKEGRFFVQGDATDLLKGYVKIRVPEVRVHEAVSAGFSFLEKSSDDALIFVGTRTSLREQEWTLDNRAVTVDEAFINISERVKS